jgi:hypothetical protein
MVTKIMLALALVILPVVGVTAAVGPGGQASSGYDRNMGSGGGNLVQRW